MTSPQHDRRAERGGEILRTPTDWAELITTRLDVGQCFAAYDLAREAGDLFQDDLRLRLLGSLALTRCGAVREGRELLAAIEPRLHLKTIAIERVETALSEGFRRLGRRGAQPTNGGGEASAWVEDLAAALATVAQSERSEVEQDGRMAAILAEIYVQSWRRLGRVDDLGRARDLWLAMFKVHGDQSAAVAAATLSWYGGDRKRARRLALQALDEAGGELAHASHRTAGAIAMAALICGDHDRAVEALACAVARAGDRPMWLAEMRIELDALARGGLEVPPDAMALLAPPALVVFTGQHPLIDENGSRRLVGGAVERRIAEAIRGELDALDAKIGYGSASAGPEILFLEAMLDRGAEVNILLPFARDDFVALCVEPAGERWRQRFENSIKLANSVTQISEDPWLGDDLVYRYANRVLDGTARLRAAMLGAEPFLLAAWDYQALANPGGAADFIDHWGDPARLRIIDLDEVLPQDEQADAPSRPDCTGTRAPARAPVSDPTSIAAMLFADIVGFSRLHDLDIARLWSFMAEMHESMKDRHPVRIIDSWGDALHVVMDSALALADYATALVEALVGHDARAMGLPLQPQLRVGLHAGPVLETTHPLSGRRMIYGGNVNRAARIEPISVPGHIYASQQFVALLTAEESMLRHEALLSGETFAPRFACEYLGIQMLPKNFGEQAIYVIKPAAGATSP